MTHTIHNTHYLYILYERSLLTTTQPKSEKIHNFVGWYDIFMWNSRPSAWVTAFVVYVKHQWGGMMCLLGVIEVRVFPSCGRWSHRVPSVGETLERMRIDGLVWERRWPSKPFSFFFFSACMREAVHSGLCLALPLTTIRLLPVVERRLAKEESTYKTETKQQEEKIERMKAEAGDEYVIKKQVHANLEYSWLRSFIERFPSSLIGSEFHCANISRPSFI